MTEASTLSPWVRLEGIGINQLPPGGKGVAPSNPISSTEKFSDGSGSVAAPNLKTFITNVLSDAVPFIDGVAPKAGGAPTWKAKKGAPKTFPNSEAPVHLYERTVSGKELDKIEGMSQFSADRKDETWFCRRSCHNNKAELKTASWAEFTTSFQEHHAESEEAFTPTVIGAREAMRWATSGIEVEVHGERWNNITMVVEEMTHKIDPKPLKNRTFPVAQVTASLVGAQEFVVVSIPLHDFHKSPYAEYAREKSLVMASYVSVERIRVLSASDEVEWIMATASNAGGVLPQWMQNLAVPSQVAKDVDLFLAWIPSQRTQSSDPVAASGNAYTDASATANESTSAPQTGHAIPKTGQATTPAEVHKDLPAIPAQ